MRLLFLNCARSLRLSRRIRLRNGLRGRTAGKSHWAPLPAGEDPAGDYALGGGRWHTCGLRSHSAALQGYALHTVSGACSLELAGALEGMGVRHCFGRLYGADLINTFKEGPEYYARLFADVGVQPEASCEREPSRTWSLSP
jgi:hypothetical protein